MKKQENNSKPSMYIYTVAQNVGVNSNQNTYDSRKKTVKKHRSLDENIVKKVERLVAQYKESNPILCNVTYKEDKSIVGYLQAIINNDLIVEKSENKTVRISLYDIKDISLFRI